MKKKAAPTETKMLADVIDAISLIDTDFFWSRGGAEAVIDTLRAGRPVWPEISMLDLVEEIARLERAIDEIKEGVS